MEQPVVYSLPCPLLTAAQDYPERPAFIDDTLRLTYGEAGNYLFGALSGFEKHGLTSGDVVAVMADNSALFAILLCAAFRTGIVLMPLNLRLKQSDWQEQIDEAQCKILLFGPPYAEQAASLSITSAPLETIVYKAQSIEACDIGQAYLLERDALILFTSGSTGRPRGAVLTWRSLYYSARGCVRALALHKFCLWYAVLPFFHIGGISIVLRTILAGSCTRIMPRFDTDAILNRIETDQVEMAAYSGMISVVPTMLSELMSFDAENGLKKLRAIIVGGAAATDAMRDEALAKGLALRTTYGMTETASMVTILDGIKKPTRLKTAGLPLPYWNIKITDDDGNLMNPWQDGRILVSGLALFSRYLNEDSSAITVGGWFDTGDRGHLSYRGYLTITGRSDDMIVSGGENIDCQRIEQALLSIEGISGAVVMARDDDYWGRRPVAFVQIIDESITEDFLHGRIFDLVPEMMIPDRITVMTELPRTGSGKIDRPALRLHYPHIFHPED